MRLALKIMLGIFVVLGLIIGGVLVYVLTSWDRTFDVPYPEIEASTDPAVLARGEYLVYGPAVCVACHGDADRMDEVKQGARVPLSGGKVYDIPLGVFYAPNITSHAAGIGERDARTLARSLRYGARYDDRAMMPFMEYHMLSDEDLTAIVSYLLSTKPVGREVPEHELSLLGKALFTFVIEPAELEEEPLEKTPERGTPEYSEYLADHVSLCVACHTERNLESHEVTGVPYAGGSVMPHEKDPENRVLVTPNLTPDPETGVMTDWSEEDFIKRFRAGEQVEGTTMPWGAYGQMTDEDLKAIYQRLRALEPVYNATGEVVQHVN